MLSRNLHKNIFQLISRNKLRQNKLMTVHQSKSQKIQIKSQICNGLEQMERLQESQYVDGYLEWRKTIWNRRILQFQNIQENYTQTMDQSRVFEKSQEAINLKMLQFMKLENNSIIIREEYIFKNNIMYQFMIILRSDNQGKKNDKQIDLCDCFNLYFIQIIHLQVQDLSHMKANIKMGSWDTKWEQSKIGAGFYHDNSGDENVMDSIGQWIEYSDTFNQYFLFAIIQYYQASKHKQFI